jgi:ferredoxin
VIKATVNQSTCVGCGLCAETCPKVFEMADGLARVIVDNVPLSEAADCRRASEECPVEAITLDE